ncbi:chymotrypsin-like elastase family member 2A isoform X2 [Amyelois transitella]|uniref:chymotrypsin-like elastase family member 2A isoform X2 n=1 Tax=Amyelois transitella TaxID=680683 RepID=UPI00299071A8|nr:chymotrypsin-like elastase family member 2A isoform X2 [Amyelois transitella]
MINLKLTKFIIRLLILMILFVVLFLISTVLYSTKYWPDVYNYVNANITIKRIPTLSELNLTIIEVSYTEKYPTTDIDGTTEDDSDSNTEDGLFSFDEFDFPSSRHKREVKIENDYSEVPSKSVVVDYFFDEDSTKLIKDLIDESKLTPKYHKDVEIMGKGNELDSGISDVFPWIVTIYIKNESKDDQYEYYCDGVLLNDRFVLTAGRCVNINNVTSSVEDLLIVLGKASLHSVGEHEMVRKVKTIITHENFTIYDGGAVNDLALMELDEPADLNSNAQGAVMIADDSDVELGATTAWGFTGELTPIIFDTEASKKCEANPEYENLFCAIYGNNIALCPSYGGLHVVKQTDRWYLRGIRTGDPERRGICLNRNVVFTELSNYKDWIDNVIAQ